MSFGGSVGAMINSMKANRNNLKSSVRKKGYDGMISKDSTSKVTMDSPKLSEAEKQKLFSEIQLKAKKEKRRELILWISVFVITAVISIYFLSQPIK